MSSAIQIRCLFALAPTKLDVFHRFVPFFEAGDLTDDLRSAAVDLRTITAPSARRSKARTSPHVAFRALTTSAGILPRTVVPS